MAILDEEALLAISTYIDLNPVAAGIAETPEASEYTSIKARVEHVEAQGRAGQLEAAKEGSVAGSCAAGGLEESLWLCPIEDRRRWDSSREGMFDGLSIGNYLLLVDYTGRLFREGKAAISAKLAGIFDRLGSRAERLAGPDGETEEGPIVRPFLRRQPRDVTSDGRATERATPGQPRLIRVGWCDLEPGMARIKPPADPSTFSLGKHRRCLPIVRY